MADLLEPQPPPSWRDRIADLRTFVTPVRVVVGVLGAVAVGVLAFLFLRTPPPPSELVLPRPDGSATPAGPATAASASGATVPSSGELAPSATAGGMIAVHAAGQVSAPGVYSVPAGARVADVITAAGGLAVEADVDALNLAAKVTDGSRVYVPRKGELAPAAGVPGAGAGAGAGGGGAGAGAGPASSGGAPVDLNSATAEQLDTLPGVGPATAAAILTYRTRHGRFKTVTELLEVPGIGPAKLEALRPLVTVA